MKSAKRHIPNNRVLLKVGIVMMSRKKARSLQYQLALRRINQRRTTGVSSANWCVTEQESNKWFPVNIHMRTFTRPMMDSHRLDARPLFPSEMEQEKD